MSFSFPGKINKRHTHTHTHRVQRENVWCIFFKLSFSGLDIKVRNAAFFYWRFVSATMTHFLITHTTRTLNEERALTPLHLPFLFFFFERPLETRNEQWKRSLCDSAILRVHDEPFEFLRLSQVRWKTIYTHIAHSTHTHTQHTHTHTPHPHTHTHTHNTQAPTHHQQSLYPPKKKTISRPSSGRACASASTRLPRTTAWPLPRDGRPSSTP